MRVVAALLALGATLLGPGCERADRGRSAPETPQPPPPGETVARTLPGDPPVDYMLRVPPAGGAGAPLFVTVHGLSRNAATHARLFARLADAEGAVLLAPLFDAPRFDDYQRRGRNRLGARADRALEALVAAVGRATGARSERLHLFGYSGGAQFVHRFVLAHPERVAAAAVASAGWYTFPDPELPYPLGIGSTTGLPGVRFRPDAFLRVPVLVTVGEDDRERDDSLRSEAEIDRYQGRTRVERARRWVAAMREAARSRGLAPAVEYRELPDVDHSFRENVEETPLEDLVFQHLFDAEREPGQARHQSP